MKKKEIETLKKDFETLHLKYNKIQAISQVLFYKNKHNHRIRVQIKFNHDITEHPDMFADFDDGEIALSELEILFKGMLEAEKKDRQMGGKK